MLKKLLVMLCLLFLVVGIVSAADNNSTGDTLKTDEDNSNEIVEIQEVASDETPKSTITVNFVNAVTGEEYGSLSNTLAQGGSWGMGMGKFNNMIANHKTFKMDGYKYTFTHWSGDNGVVDSTQLLYCTGEDYTVTFYANYDKELLGRLTFIVNDEHGHNGHQMTYNDEADYKFTFKDPVDVEEGYKFLYYEHAKTGEKYNPGDVFSMLYSEFQGQDVTVEVNAIYEKIQEDEPVNDTNGTVIDNNTTDNETDTNGTAIDNSTADNETDTNGTAIDNGADDNKQVDDIDEDNGQSGNDSAKGDDGNISGTLINHKTAIAFTGLVFLVIIMISVLIYIRRNEH